MTLPVKSSRKIVVDEIAYRWMATGNDMVIDVIIEKDNTEGQKLKTSFDYHNELQSGEITRQETKITPDTIKRIILHALEKGWAPGAKGRPIFIVDGEELIPRNVR